MTSGTSVRICLPVRDGVSLVMLLDGYYLSAYAHAAAGLHHAFHLISDMLTSDVVLTHTHDAHWCAYKSRNFISNVRKLG